MNAAAPGESKAPPIDTKRKTWSAEERDLIVRASCKEGATVSGVARVFGVQPWQIYEWRKRAREIAQPSKTASLLPVQVTEPDSPDQVEPKQSCRVVIETPRTRITITGLIDAVVVRTVLECLGQ